MLWLDQFKTISSLAFSADVHNQCDELVDLIAHLHDERQHINYSKEESINAIKGLKKLSTGCGNYECKAWDHAPDYTFHMAKEQRLTKDVGRSLLIKFF